MCPQGGVTKFLFVKFTVMDFVMDFVKYVDNFVKLQIIHYSILITSIFHKRHG